MFEFRLPDLGEGIHEGEILKWHVGPGDPIVEDAPLVDVETDKAAVTIPSPKSGLVVSVTGKPGDVVRTGQILCVIDESTDRSVPAFAPAILSGAPSAGTHHPAPPLPSSQPTHPQKPVAAPATRRLARELSVDLTQANPTGPGGRVTDEDVRRLAASASAAEMKESIGTLTSPPSGSDIAETSIPDAQAPLPSPGVSGNVIPLLDLSPLPDFAAFGPIRREPLRSIRRKTAIRMVTSATLIPQVAHQEDIDVTELEALRRAERPRRQGRPGEHLTLLAFVAKAAALGLRDHPAFNASVDPFREEVIFKDHVHIGVAVDSGRGLVVPVIRDADRKSIVAIADAVADLARRAREGTLTAEQMRGGTFTITNIGFLGGTGMLPLVNHPESAILGMARAADRSVIRDGQVVVRTILPVVLSFDHRVADGADAARFVNDLKRRLERPVELMLEA